MCEGEGVVVGRYGISTTEQHQGWGLIIVSGGGGHYYNNNKRK
jgi:hypothetical protein